MFKTVNGKKTYKYRIVKKPFTPLNQKNLWDAQRSEYTEQNYPDMIYSILEEHKKASYEFIKQVLEQHHIATDLAFIIIATNELIKDGKIRKTANYVYHLI